MQPKHIMPSNIFIYVESIELIDPTNSLLTEMPVRDEEGGKTYGFMTPYKETSGGFTVSLKAVVKPSNATIKEVYFYSEKSDTTEYSVETSPDDKTIVNITFYKSGVYAQGRAQSTDGKQTKVGFVVYAY